MSYSNPDKVISQLWSPDEHGTVPQIYAILDAARNEGIYPAVMDFDGESSCLYQLYGGIPEALAEAAPYLVKLQPEDPFTTRLSSEGWGDSWGIFLESSASLDELKLHFRRFLMVKDEEGNELYFRYYDPRVLRPYLPPCNETELEVFFGPVGRFFVEGEDENTLIKYSRDGSELVCGSISLGE